MATASHTVQLGLDRLCDNLAPHLPRLRSGSFGRQGWIDSIRVRRVALDRHAVYRLQSGNTWYLKMPRRDDLGTVEHERLGAAVVQQLIADDEHYRAIAVTHVDLENQYVLTSEVLGRPLNNRLYRAALTWGLWNLPRQTYWHLGRILGRLHDGATSASRAWPPYTKASADHELSKALETIHRDTLAGRLADWLASVDRDAERVFVHGNLRRENILLQQDRITLIDFEDCGSGSRYNDLSKVLSDLFMTRCAPCLPWRTFFRAANALLQGYRSEHAFRSSTLIEYLTMRIGSHYAWKCGSKRVTVAGVPASRKRLYRMTDDLLNLRLDRALPGIQF